MQDLQASVNFSLLTSFFSLGLIPVVTDELVVK